MKVVSWKPRKKVSGWVVSPAEPRAKARTVSGELNVPLELRIQGWWAVCFTFESEGFAHFEIQTQKS